MGKGTQKSPNEQAQSTRAQRMSSQLAGLPHLLRAWRSSAGEQMQLGRPLAQAEVAGSIGRSVRWYRDLENGAEPRLLERSVLDALADTLLLNRDERLTLHLYALGGALPASSPRSADGRAGRILQDLLDRQMPMPAHVNNLSYDITNYNQAMATWFPWVQEPGANMLRWVLLHPDARLQLADWTKHAGRYLAQLRYLLAEYPHELSPAHLLADILQDADCRQLWKTHTTVTESPDGQTIRLLLPIHQHRPVDVVSYVLYPAALPGHRLVGITWAHGKESW